MGDHSMRFTGDELRKRLQAYDRTPFLDLLAIMIESAPTADDIRRLSKSAPDKYFAALGQLARTSGFTDKTEQTHTINLNIGQMSDSQLEDRARQIAAQLQLPPPVIDAEFESVPSEARTPPAAGADAVACGADVPPLDSDVGPMPRRVRGKGIHKKG